MIKLFIAIVTFFASHYRCKPLRTPMKSLYDRLGNVFAIAPVIDHFSDAVVQNPIVGKTSKAPPLEEIAHAESGQIAKPEVYANPMGL